METKINLAEILKDKPQGTKLYSPIFGNLRYEDLVPDLGEFTVVTSDNTLSKHSFRSDTRYNRHGEPLMLLPSKEMRDWSKFAWKKGDVLVSIDGGTEVIFDTWYDETYTSFYCKHYLNSEDENKIIYYQEFLCTTERYSLEDKDSAQTYINTIEERLGGKLNLKTLEIEKTQPEFKDGDIVVYGKSVAICRKIYKHTLCFYVSLNEMFGLLFDDEVESSKEYRFATEEEKQQLFKALAKENKAWDAEKKQIVDLKPKVEFKPFDKVVAYGELTEEWVCDIFSHYSKNYKGKEIITCIGGGTYYKALPYNEETIKLLGTTKDVEG